MLRQAAVQGTKSGVDAGRRDFSHIKNVDILERQETNEFSSYTGTGGEAIKLDDKRKRIRGSFHNHREIERQSLVLGFHNVDSKKWYLINPGGLFKNRWDYTILFCLAFTSIVTPIEVAFSRPEQPDAEISSSESFLYVFNWLVNGIFIVDVGVTFLTPFMRNGLWVTSLKKIFVHYLFGMLIIDVISVIPFEALGRRTGDPDLSRLGVLRVLKLLRLIKLLRIFRANRVIANLEAHTDISYSIFQLLKYLNMMIFASHWLACGFRLVPDFHGDPRDPLTLEYNETNWLSAYFEEGGLGELPCVGGAATEAAGRCYSALDEYLLAMYWSVMTVTTIGYGDVLPVTSAGPTQHPRPYSYRTRAKVGVLSARDVHKERSNGSREK